MRRRAIHEVITITVAVGLLAITANAAAAMAETKIPAGEELKAETGFGHEFLNQLKDVETKLVDLAEAIPAAKYAWRPAKGVRSIAEVYLHVAASNYSLPAAGKFEPPAGLDLRSLEKSTTVKGKIVEEVKRSFEHVRQAALKTSGSDLDKPVKLFGRQTTMRDLFFTLALHQHEHLGQSIAYARTNGVVPPWTAASQARQARSER